MSSIGYAHLELCSSSLSRLSEGVGRRYKFGDDFWVSQVGQMRAAGPSRTSLGSGLDIITLKEYDISLSTNGFIAGLRSIVCSGRRLTPSNPLSVKDKASLEPTEPLFSTSPSVRLASCILVCAVMPLIRE